jgi:peptidoglycan-associated lipoprotein
MRHVLIATVLATAVLLTGCPKRDEVRDGAATGEDPNASESASASGASGDGLEAGEALGGGEDAQQPTEGLLAQRIVFFDYDQADVRADFADLISAHARNLAANPRLRVRLEGHSDERGSREYNIGLGERRAQAVRRALMLQGAGDDQIATVSYGEERPATLGSDEATWGQNRRVEIVYVN